MVHAKAFRLKVSTTLNLIFQRIPLTFGSLRCGFFFEWLSIREGGHLQSRWQPRNSLRGQEYSVCGGCSQSCQRHLHGCPRDIDSDLREFHPPFFCFFIRATRLHSIDQCCCSLTVLLEQGSVPLSVIVWYKVPFKLFTLDTVFNNAINYSHWSLMIQWSKKLYFPRISEKKSLMPLLRYSR